MSEPTSTREPIARLMARERAPVWVGIAGVTLAAWAYLVHLHRGMTGAGLPDGMGAMAGMAPRLVPWTAADFLATVAMWMGMMVGMMLPAAAPVILLFAAVNRQRRQQGRPAVATGAFLLAYLLVWGGFSVVAALAQWGLHDAALLSPAMAASSPVLGGALLVAAGVYQLTPLKAACLAHCRSPLGFLMTQWREGTRGAFRMGGRHGAYCLGCCWVLMGLLFVTGVMNLVWVAAVTAFVLVEKVAPGGVLIGRVASIGLIGAGLVMLGGAARALGL